MTGGVLTALAAGDGPFLLAAAEVFLEVFEGRGGASERENDTAPGLDVEDSCSRENSEGPEEDEG